MHIHAGEVHTYVFISIDTYSPIDDVSLFVVMVWQEGPQSHIHAMSHNNTFATCSLGHGRSVSIDHTMRVCGVFMHTMLILPHLRRFTKIANFPVCICVCFFIVLYINPNVFA